MRLDEAGSAREKGIMAILTDSHGLIAGPVAIAGGGRVLRAYHARPDVAARVPVVVVMHQTYGINDYTRDVCRRFAKAGYFAVLPNLYERYGSVDGLSREQIAGGIAKAVEDRGVMDDIRACAEWAATAGGDAGRLGVIGFAWGAQFVWLACAEIAACRAGVSWYGRLVRDVTPQRPGPWRQTVAGLRAPVLGLYAGTDPYVSPVVFAEMRAALADAPVATELIWYQDASHGFHADYQPQYREIDAKDGWDRQMAWLKRYGLS